MSNNFIKINIFIILIFSGSRAFCEYDTLKLLGQVSGGACFSVKYKDNRLYAGAGASILVYDATDPKDTTVIARRSFRSLVNRIIVRSDTVLFVGANHDGLYALDGTKPDLPILAYFPMSSSNRWVADIKLIPPDTIWLCDMVELQKLRFTGTSFDVLGTYLTGRQIDGVTMRDTLMAVCTREFLSGNVELYSIASGTPRLINVYNNSVLSGAAGIRFADLRNDIIYVLGGEYLNLSTHNLWKMGGIASDFICLQIVNDSLREIVDDTFWGCNPNPSFASPCVINMASRNDTLFLATTAALDTACMVPGGPTLDPLHLLTQEALWSDCPVFDGTKLPDSLPVIGHIIPGLWFFDVTLHDKLPDLGIASEWCGVLWTNISHFCRDSFDVDTIAMHPTGGWGIKSYVYGDTLWLAWEGYGVGIFDVSNPEKPLQIGRIPGEFAYDLTVLDSIAYVAKSTKGFRFYNIASWWRGSQPVPIDSLTPLNSSLCNTIAQLKTDVGTRIACGSDSGIFLIDPADIPNFKIKARFLNTVTPGQLVGFGDTLFVAGGDSEISVMVISKDSATLIAKTKLSESVDGICRQGNFVATSCAGNGVYWFQFTGDSLIEKGNWNPIAQCWNVEYKDSLLYVACSNEGLYILDVWHSASPETLAWYPGSGGYPVGFGSDFVSFDKRDNIYLTDYHAGCYALSPYKTGIEENTSYHKKLEIQVCPSPFRSLCNISASVKVPIEIFDLAGRQVAKLYGDKIVWKPQKYIKTGFYFIRIKLGKTSVTKKVLYLK